VLPLLGIMLIKQRARALLYILPGIYIYAYLNFALNVWHPDNLESRLILGHSLFGRGVVFLLGISASGIYLLHGDRIRSWLTSVPLARSGLADLVLFGLLIGLDQLLLHYLGKVGYFRAEIKHHYYHIFEGLILSVFILCILLAPLRLKRLFCNKPLSYLGVISYSIYLVHYPVIYYGYNFLKTHISNAAQTSITASVALAFTLSLITIALSSLTYNFIEKPFLKRKESFK
jgi:peptidoglycan/LPS O-acetylase OafA/YrhL